MSFIQMKISTYLQTLNESWALNQIVQMGAGKKHKKVIKTILISVLIQIKRFKKII